MMTATRARIYGGSHEIVTVCAICYVNNISYAPAWDAIFEVLIKVRVPR